MLFSRFVICLYRSPNNETLDFTSEATNNKFQFQFIETCCSFLAFLAKYTNHPTWTRYHNFDVTIYGILQMKRRYTSMKQDKSRGQHANSFGEQKCLVHVEIYLPIAFSTCRNILINLMCFANGCLTRMLNERCAFIERMVVSVIPKLRLRRTEMICLLMMSIKFKQIYISF